MEVIHNAPTHESFIPLSTHQSQTPESFFSGPPVLYHHTAAATLRVQANELASAPALKTLFEDAQPSTNDAPTTNGHAHGEEDEREMEVKGVDIWVSSERFILFSATKQGGLSIPYPSISLHALQRSTPPSLFLQLVTESSTFDDHDPDATVSLSIIPNAVTDTPADPDPTTSTDEAIAAPQEAAQLLYTALSDCADLHPDPASPGSGDEGGGTQPSVMFEGNGASEAPYTSLNGTAAALPPPMPGSSGWITAENVREFFDEEGNWRGQGQALGDGAGSVRRREEEDAGMDGDGDAQGGESEETKWRRTD